MRIFLRDKAIIGSSVVIPIFFLIVLPVVMFQSVPIEFLPALRGFLVIAMVTLLIMSTAVSNLPGSIAADRGNDLYSKLSSMPVSPYYECLGRILTVFVFSGLGSMVVLGLGLFLGAELAVGVLDLLPIVGIASVLVLFTAGLGLIIASVVKSESAAAHVGVAIVLVNYFIGIAFPYSELPDLLKPVVHVNPISIANNMIATIALGEGFVGYNPFSYMDATLLFTVTGSLLIIGLRMYAGRCWRR
jgi:ABC-2 type transport system permease protein